MSQLTALVLEEALVNCPSSWQNFINFLQDPVRNPGFEFYGSPIPNKILNELLKPFGGYYNNKLSQVDFKTGSGLTMFLLKWS